MTVAASAEYFLVIADNHDVRGILKTVLGHCDHVVAPISFRESMLEFYKNPSNCKAAYIELDKSEHCNRVVGLCLELKAQSLNNLQVYLISGGLAGANAMKIAGHFDGLLLKPCLFDGLFRTLNVK